MADSCLPHEARRDYETPLSEAVLHHLLELYETRRTDDGFVFPSKRGQPLTDMAATALLRKMDFRASDGRVITAHGMRSAFRDWVANETHFDRTLAEEQLAHVLPGVESAYRRDFALEKRREMLEAWAAFVTGAERSNVVSPHG